MKNCSWVISKVFTEWMTVCITHVRYTTAGLRLRMCQAFYNNIPHTSVSGLYHRTRHATGRVRPWTRSSYATGAMLSAILMLSLVTTGCDSPDDPYAVPEHVSDEELTSVPEWAQDAIWYQIFVERFRDGDSDNQPDMVSIDGSWPHEQPESWAPTPWGHDWYTHDDWAGDTDLDFYEWVHMRRYGGDLQGVLDQLDYLQDLGITAIYFNPLNDAPSMHKYDARNFRHIDVNFGPDPEGDRELMAQEDPADPDTWVWTAADKMFLKVIEEAHQRDIRVIMDYSWNHTGITFWAWQHILEHQEDSPYADWYQIDRFDDPDTDENEFEYSGWAGVPELPQFRRYDSVDEFDHGDLVPGDLHPDLKRHIFAVTRRWMAPDGDVERGVDGFRLDVAELIPVDFWRDYRKYVRSINPDAILIGELWWADWPDEMMDPTDWLQGDIFDAIMNYRWYMPTRQWLGGAVPGLVNPSEYIHHLDSVSTGVREEVLRANMNLTASHDSPRFSTSIYNPVPYKYRVNPRENPDYKIHRPDERTWRDVRLILAQQLTWPGAPHVWMGDEFGMWGADDPDNRKPVIWPDLEFEDETTHPFDRDRPRDEVAADMELWNYYRYLIHLRRDNPVFSRGELNILLADDDRNVLIYERTMQDTDSIADADPDGAGRSGEAVSNRAIVLFNNHESETAEVTIPVEDPQRWIEVLDLQAISRHHSDDGLEVAIPAKSAAIFIKSGEE